MNRAPSLAHRLSADVADLRQLRETEPDAAAQILAMLVAELVAMSQGSLTLTEQTGCEG